MLFQDEQYLHQRFFCKMKSKQVSFARGLTRMERAVFVCLIPCVAFAGECSLHRRDSRMFHWHAKVFGASFHSLDLNSL